MVYYCFNHIYWLMVSTHPMNITVINWNHPRCRQIFNMLQSSICFQQHASWDGKKNTHKTHPKTTQNRFWNQHFDDKINEIHWIPPFWNHQPGPAKSSQSFYTSHAALSVGCPKDSGQPCTMEPCWALLVTSAMAHKRRQPCCSRALLGHTAMA